MTLSIDVNVPEVTENVAIHEEGSVYTYLHMPYQVASRFVFRPLFVHVLYNVLRFPALLHTMMTVTAHDGLAYTISTHSNQNKQQQQHRQQRSPTTSPRPSTTRTKLTRLSSPPPSEVVSAAKMFQRNSRCISSSGSDIFDGLNSVSARGRTSPNGICSAEENINGHVSANGVAEKKIIKQQKIDWEIPRKILHSSIGMLLSFSLVFVGQSRPLTVCLFVFLQRFSCYSSLYDSYGPENGRIRIVVCLGRNCYSRCNPST